MAKPYKNKSYDDDFVTEMMKKAKQGAYLIDLEREYGVTYSTLVKWCNQLTIKPTKKPRPSKHDWKKIKERIK